MAKKEKSAIENYQSGTKKITAAAKGGASRQEIRQMVVAHNKLFRATKNAAKAKINVQEMWSYMPKTTESKVVAKPKVLVKEKVYKNHGGAEQKNLLRDETYDNYVQEIRRGQGSGEGDPEGLYKKTAPLTKKRGFIMKRNRK
tara:strand:- start:393 stop:821 length:429 start_codon:yes stop_codon:yes gene_type:complete